MRIVRLWHQEMIPYLPPMQLNGQHRECCALRGLGWGRPHSTVNYVFRYDPARLVRYHFLIMSEKKKRFHVGTDPAWTMPLYRGINCPPWRDNEFDLKFLEIELSGNIYPEHNDEYMVECFLNLKRKGFKLLDEKEFVEKFKNLFR